MPVLLGFRPANQAAKDIPAGARDGKPVVLALGDSLTGGLICGFPNYPYTDRLARLLNLAPGTVFNEHVAGLPVSKMSNMLQTELGKQRTFPLTHVVILGGTNDLREQVPPDVIIRNLKQLHDMIRAKGLKPVAVTVPRFGRMDRAFGIVTEPRNKINESLRAAAAAGSQGRGPVLLLADLDAALEQQPTAVRDGMFSDSVHFNTQGYDLIADSVAEAIRSDTGGKALVAAPSAPASFIPAPPSASIFSPNGSTFSPNGSTFSPNGSTFSPNGSTFSPNGSTFSPNGSKFSPNSSTFSPNGSSFSPNGSVFNPNGIGLPAALDLQALNRTATPLTCRVLPAHPMKPHNSRNSRGARVLYAAPAPTHRFPIMNQFVI